MSKISIKTIEKIRKELGLTHLVIFGINCDGVQHVASDGASVSDAIEAATFGNKLKENPSRPKNLYNSKPLERLCKNCSFWQVKFKPTRRSDA